MQTVVDLHIHSKYSRACSQDLRLPNLAVWGRKKGISVMGTGDFTHPGWFKSISEELVEVREGLFGLRDQTILDRTPPLTPPSKGGEGADSSPYEGEARRGLLFMLTAEVASIYKMGDKVRRVHNLLFAPSVDAVDRLIKALEKRGVNLKADGRPIMGVSCRDLVMLCKDVDERIEVVPAHAWTPHFGVFGSLSGFDSLEEAFGDAAKYVFAIETGLSSDPKMNWQVSGLDRISLISNSDAHSLRKLGREANVFDIEEKELSYDKIISAIKRKDPKEFLYTIEFFPEEGKYHLDGHMDCKMSMLPSESKKRGGVCPVCGRKLLLGVMNRVDALGDREFGFVPPHSVPFKNAIPLEEIIAATLNVGVGSKKVGEMYERMVGEISNAKFQISNGGNNSPRPSLTLREGVGQLQGEFGVLLEWSREEIEGVSNAQVAESVMRVREGRVHIVPGYDGLFGEVEIYGAAEREKMSGKVRQESLF